LLAPEGAAELSGPSEAGALADGAGVMEASFVAAPAVLVIYKIWEISKPSKHLVSE